MKIAVVATAAGLLLANPASAAEAGVRLVPPRLQYVSAFAGYGTPADAKPIEWSRSNAVVGELQGHAGHWRVAPSARGADTAGPQAPKAGAARP
jgi:hypothetical protein